MISYDGHYVRIIYSLITFDLYMIEKLNEDVSVPCGPVWSSASAVMHITWQLARLLPWQAGNAISLRCCVVVYYSYPPPCDPGPDLFCPRFLTVRLPPMSIGRCIPCRFPVGLL